MKLLQLCRSAGSSFVPKYTKACQYSTRAADSAYPYTSELYKKNYIKYPVQSRSAISHDYVFHGPERLQSIEERMKEFEDPSDKLTHDRGKQVYYTKLQELKSNIDNIIQKNKTDKLLEIKSKDLESNLFECCSKMRMLLTRKNVNFSRIFFRFCQLLNEITISNPTKICELKVNFLKSNKRCKDSGQ